MAENLLEAVRQNLGYEPLHKVDPNLQEVKNIETLSVREKLAQAAIPAVLTAFSVFVKSEQGAETLLNLHDEPIDKDDLFHGENLKVIDRIVDYSGAARGEVEQTMEKITHEAEKLTLESVGADATPDKVKAYISAQRHTILLYLPASLQLGKLLDDNSLDDRTNKMEGPMSNIAHAIENAMSGGSVQNN